MSAPGLNDRADSLEPPWELADRSRSRRLRRAGVALVVAAAVIGAGLATARRIGIKVYKPAKMACQGTPIKVGVRAQGAARGFRITISDPAKKKVFSRKSRAGKKWKYWLYSPTKLGVFKTEYRTALGKRRFTTQVAQCQNPGPPPVGGDVPQPPPAPGPPPPPPPPPLPPPPPSCGSEVCLSDNDADSAIFTMSNMAPGSTDAGCIKVTYAGSLSSNVRLYGTTAGGLAQYLVLKVTRGMYLPLEPAFDSCDNFVPDIADYGFGPGGVIYDGILLDYPDDLSAGLPDPSLLLPEAWTDLESHVYKFEITLQDNNDAQGLDASQVFTWEARDVV